MTHDGADISPAPGRPAPPARSRLGRIRAAALVAGGLLLAVAASLVLVVVLFAQGNPQLSARILDVVNDALGSDSTRLAADRVSGRLFGAAELRHPRLLVRTRDGEVTWAEAEWLRVEYDVMQLLFGDRRALRVAINSPRIALTHDRNGNLVVPRFATHPRRGPTETVTQISVRFSDGAFTLDRGDVRFGGLRGEIETRSQEGQTTILVKRFEGRSEMKGRPGPVRVEGRATLTGRNMRVEPLSVELDSTRVSATVDWDLAGARVVSSTVRFAPLDLDEVMRLLALRPVTRGTLTGEASFAGDPVRGSGRIRLAGVVGGEPVDTLAAAGTMVPGAIRIEDLHARFRGARVRGSGIFETRGALEADVFLEDVDPKQLPWLRGNRAIPGGNLNARVRLTARKSRPMALADASVELLPGRFGRVEIRQGRARLRRLSDGAFALDSAWVDVPGGRVEARGALARDRTLQLQFAGTVRDAGSMKELLRPVDAEAGTGRVEGELTGPSSAPAFRVRTALRSGRLRNGVRFDSLQVEARGTLGSALAAQAELLAIGLGAGDRPLGNATALLYYDKSGLELRRYRQVLGDTTLALRGRVSFPRGMAHAVLDSAACIVGTRVWRNEGPVDATFDGEKLHVTRLRLALESGSLDLAGDFWPRGSRISARGSVHGLDLGRAVGPADSARTVEGRVSIDFEADGPLDDPDVSAAVNVLRPRLRAISGDSLAIRVHYEPGLLTLEQARLAAGEGRIELTGRAEPALRLGDWVRSLAKGDKGWASKVPLDLQLSVDSLALGRLAPLAPGLATLSGSASLRARIGGTAASPEIEARGGGRNLAYRGVRLESAELEGGYSSRRFSITRLALHQGKSVSEIQGFVPVDLSLTAERQSVPDDSMQLAVRMNEIDFSVATLFIPMVAASTGKLTVNADVAGTPAHPRVSGTLRLADGTLRFAGRDERIENVQIEGTLSQERITATRITATEGRRGQVRGAGWWRWVRGTPLGQYEVQLHAQDFTATDRETYLLRFTGDFDIRNGTTADGRPMPRITGTASVSKGELTWTQQPAGPEERPPATFLYEVALEMPRNLWFRNLDTEIELGGRLIAKNEGRNDILLGDLDVLRGRYYVCYAKFQIVSGTIGFHEVDRIDPEVTIDAEAHVRGPGPNAPDETVKMALSGHSSQLKITPYDDRGSNPSYLWKSLCIGQVSSAGTEQAIGQRQDTAAGGTDVTLPIRDYLFRNLERWLGDVGLIDTIDLKSGEVTTRVPGANAPTIGAVGVGKYVTPTLYLRYSRDFSGTAEQKISAEYRVTRRLLLKGEQVQHPAQNPSAGAQYNLDLKIRFEY